MHLNLCTSCGKSCGINRPAHNARGVAMYTPCMIITDNEHTEDPMRSHAFQDVLGAIKKATHALGHIDLFCDYDGVLAAIAPRPEDAFLDERTRDILQQLSRHDSFHFGIVSGRSLADISMRVGVSGITYAGNHGLEINGPDIQKVQQIPNHMRDTMRTLAGTLQRAMRPYPGVIVEDKTLVVSVHVRQAGPDQIPLILSELSALVADRNSDRLLRVTSGKCVIEVRPNVDWDKGKAVRFLLEKRHGANWSKHVLPVYLGDDETDEDAFLALRDHGITVRVGHPSSEQSAAHYTLQNTDEVHIFLDQLLLTLL